MSTIKSSSEHLVLNADGANKSVKFQSDGVEKASINSAGLFTSTTIDATKLTGAIDATKLTGALPVIDGSNLTGIDAATVSTTPPTSPTAGDMWFNSSTNIISTVGANTMASYSGVGWNQMSNLVAATGGTITYFGGYTVHEFTSSGTFNIPVSRSCEILVVGGGGGGGHDHAAAAGAGGLLYGTLTLNGSYSLTVGGGGAYSTTYDSNDGVNSVFGTINATAIGGGGGGTNYRAGRTGGSGGGGGAGGVGSSNQGNSGGLTGYGNSGGTRTHCGPNYPTGGGGGAGGTGGSTSNCSGPTAAGGVGKDYSSIFGTSVGDSGWFAGGGGGGHYSGSGAITVGSGGNGGGGDGGHTSLNAGDGHDNTGGGGGGADRNGSSRSGNGGSGVIIVRYIG